MMATLVLTTIGTALGGPIGGAIGALAGQALDARLLSPKGRKGPRIDDLRVQLSSYGAMVPQLFGRMRVAGTVIWASELKEHRQKQSNGKGRGSTTTYSYSVSLAVALSSRPIAGVRRIWAEGNLLRGSAGDFKSPAVMRVHPGSEDQMPDPLIAAIEGAGQAPAYRGIGYAVLEDLDLAPFGNRIPSLTFEVDAEGSAASLGTAAASLLGGATDAVNLVPVEGLAIADTTRAAALGQLQPFIEPWKRVDDGTWQLQAGMSQFSLGEPLAARTGDGGRRRAGDLTLPRAVEVATYDPARDFGATLQRALVPGGAGQTETIALPAAMGADEGKRLAMDHAAALARRRESDGVAHGFGALALVPGQLLMDGGGRRNRIVERQIEGAGVRLTLGRWADSATGAVAADGGRGAVAGDLVHGPSVAALVDMPVRGEPAADAVRLLAVAGTGPGWRSAAVAVRAGLEFDPEPVAQARRALAIGTIVRSSGSGACPIYDDRSAILIELSDPAMTLTEAGDAALLSGVNLAAAGREFIQFGRVEPVGPRRWRLTRLLRGRLGSEAEAAMAGDDFVLLDDPALVALPARVGLAQLGAGASVDIAGPGDEVPVVLSFAARARAMQPLSPAAPSAGWTADGGLRIAWVRRTLAGLGWIDGVDVPPGPAGERNRVTIRAGQTRFSVETEDDAIMVGAAQVAVWRAASSLLIISVERVGLYGLSEPATLAFAL